MKDHLIDAINIFSNLYPDYEIVSIYLWETDENNKVTYKISGEKGASEISDMIKVDL